MEDTYDPILRINNLNVYYEKRHHLEKLRATFKAWRAPLFATAK